MPSGAVVTEDSDAFGRLTSTEITISNESDGSVLSLTEAFEYLTYEGGATTSLISAITMTDGTVYHYTYDAAGNITSVTKNNETTAFATYVYDGLGQLIRENRRELNKTYVYSYDIDGNILSKTEYAYTVAETPSDAADTKTYGYSYVNGLYSLTSANDGTITYDASGNPLTYYNGMTFTWKDGRKLASVSGENVSTSYVYNGDGLRTQKGVFDGTNLYSVNYFYEGSKLMALEKYNGKTTDYMFFMYDQSDNIVGFEFNDTAYYYIKNMQGDVIGILDRTGNTVVKYSYTAWGEPISVTDGNGVAITDKYSMAYMNPIRYRGYVYDDETGLYYVSSRYYDPEIGRFLNSDDPMFLGANGNIASYNLFAYCENNPINMVDFTGNIAANVIGAIIGGVIGAVGGAFLGKWLADRLGITGFWARAAFIGAVGLLVGAAAAAIGYFIGPYVAKAWSVWSAKLSGLIKGTFKSIAKITSKKMSHINVSKHLWNKVMKKVTKTQIKTLIYQGIRKDTWNLLSNGSVKILYKNDGQIIVIAGKVVNNIFQIGDAWVWNGIGTGGTM